MVRDLRHRFVDGLILASLQLTAGARRRARARGGAGGRDRHAAEGDVASTRCGPIRAGAPPRPCATSTRSAAAGSRSSTARTHTAAGLVAPARLSRRPPLVRARPRRGADRGRRRLHGRAGPPRGRAPARAGAARTRSSARTTCSPSARSPRCATARARRARTTSRSSGWTTRASRLDLAGADHRRPRLRRARAARGRAAARSGSSSPAASRAGRRGRAAPRRPRLVAERRHEHRPRAGAAATGRRPRAAVRGAGLSGREALLLLIPALLPIVILSVLPLARGIYLGFTDSQAGLGVDTHFIGLDNFRALIHDDLFINSFKIGLIWAVSRDGDPVRASRSGSRCCSARRCAAAGSPARSRSSRGRCPR